MHTSDRQYLNHQTYTLSFLAEYANLELHGDPNVAIRGIATLEQAELGDLSFFSNLAYKADLQKTRATAVVLEPEALKYLEKNSNRDQIACLISVNPRLAMARISALFLDKVKLKHEQSTSTGIHKTAVIGSHSHIDSSAVIGPYVVIGEGVTIGPNVRIAAGTVVMDSVNIGENSVIGPRVILHDRIQIGSNVVIHSGAVIGADGFGFAIENGHWVRIPHLGKVIIGSGSHIGSNTAIDRGAIGDTIIGEDVIIDNLVQVAHNVQIGAHTAIAGCVAIAGSTKIGKYCLVGGSSSIAGHLTIADHVHITGASGVNRSLHQAGSYSSGLPVQTSEKWRRNAARFQFLDQLAIKVKKLEANISNSDIEQAKNEEDQKEAYDDY